MTPELWELIPLVLDPAHLDSNSSGGGSQPLSLGPGGSMDGRVARAGPGRHDSAGIDSREGCMALPRVPSIAAGTRVVAATSSTDPPHSQCGEQQRKWRKRKRNLYSWNQLHILESFFHREKYPNLPQAEMLSGMTGLTYQQIRIWFQNRRGKHRRLYAGDRTPGSSLCTLQAQLCAHSWHDPFSPVHWPALPGSPGPDPGMQWALQGPASSAFDSRINLPPLQAPSMPTDFQAYNTWTPQTSTETLPTAVHPVTINSSFLHISQVQSMESLELSQLINDGESLLSSFCMDSQGNSQWGAQPWGYASPGDTEGLTSAL
ncbi:homeobox protein prophet of Pit-1-like [Mauremys reevesii]|uniref:homeobox protein prophet of Pit-1-like n=1 Tax=Mauremys reevesii TaxID=260615 RepID=UPI00193FF531|nr:homeobox protein prophet of Pit-1-like [Mauremys reevesii]